MAVSGTIDRTSLSLTPLAFGSGTSLSLFVGGLTFGRRAWRRQVVSSRFATGEYEMDAALDQTHETLLRFRARATSESALETLCSTLVTAVEQVTWNLSVTVSGYTWPTVTCTRSDSDIAFDTAHVRGLVAAVNVYTTRNPTSAGPI